MELPPIPEYSHIELEQIGAKFHQKYCGDPVDIPIDIELILERALGVDIIPFYGLERQYRINGILAKDLAKDRFLIYVDEEMMENQEERYRFTLSEKYAHSVLHRDIFQDVEGLDDFLHLQRSITSEEIWLMDRNARYLAGAILVPAPHVCKLARELLPPQLDPLKSLLAKVRKEELFRAAAQILHGFYNVSQGCMLSRLSDKSVRLDTWLVQQYR